MTFLAKTMAVALVLSACTRTTERFAGGPLTLGDATLTPNPARDGSAVSIGFAVQGVGLTACAVSVAGQSAACKAAGRCDCVFTIGSGTAHGLATVQLSATNASGTTTASTSLVIDKLAPVVDASQFAIARMPSGAADMVTIAAGAISDALPAYPGQAISAVSIYADATTGAAIASATAPDLSTDAALTLAGTAIVSYPELWLTATDAAGNESARIAIVAGEDTSPPLSTGAVVHDGTDTEQSAQASTQAITANWSGFGNDTASYDYNVSSSSACTGDVVSTRPVGNVTSVTTADLSLADGATYYSCVRARDKAQNASAWVASSGVSVEATATQIVSTSPAAAAVGVDPKVVITITFSGPIETTSFATALTLGSASGPVAATVSTSATAVSLTPSAALRFNTPYTVTLSTAAHDLAGHALSATSFTFTTRDGAWRAPLAIQNRPGFVFLPRIFLDAKGGEMALWEFATTAAATQGTLAALHADATSGWDSDPTNIDPIGQVRTDQTPDFGFFADGSGISEWTGSGQFAHIGHFSTSDTWQFTYGPSVHNDRAAATASDGLSHWFALTEITDFGSNALTQVTHDGGSPLTIDTNPSPSTEAGLGLAASASGAATAIWWRGSPAALFGDHFDGSAWEPSQQLDSNSGFDAINRHVAMDTAGNAFVSFEQTPVSDDRSDVSVARYVVGQGWSAPVTIDTDAPSINSASALAVNARGDAVVVWYEINPDDASTTIRARIFSTATNDWSAQVQTLGSGNVSLPDVAIDNDGNIIAIWLQDDGFGANIFGARYLARSTSWQASAKVEDDSGTPNHPRIAIDAQGRAAIIWERFDGVNVNAWVDRFE